MPDVSVHQVDSLAWPELGEALTAAGSPMLLIPLGSTEQHGPHLPIGTDTTIATRWCRDLARYEASLGNHGIFVAPTLPYGSAGEHQDFPGTLSIGAEALHLVLVELTRSAAHDYDRVVFVSGHAGNFDALRTAVRQLRNEGHNVAGLVPIIPGSDAHAGLTETSIMLAIDEQSVRLESVEPGATEPIADLLERLQTHGMRSVTANGILGDPTAASRAEGQRALNHLVAISLYDQGHC